MKQEKQSQTGPTQSLNDQAIQGLVESLAGLDQIIVKGESAVVLVQIKSRLESTIDYLHALGNKKEEA
jgi:hypothetical protein